MQRMNRTADLPPSSPASTSSPPALRNLLPPLIPLAEITLYAKRSLQPPDLPHLPSNAHVLHPHELDPRHRSSKDTTTERGARDAADEHGKLWITHP